MDSLRVVIGKTVRELVAECNRDADYEAWLARLRRENAESERQRELAQHLDKIEFGSEPTDWPDGTFDDGEQP